MKRDRSIPEVKITDAAFQFFFQMAGLVDTEHRARSAIDLAKAEVTAGELGWSWSWEYDAESWDPGDTDYKPREVLGCVLKNSHGQVLASLWGIADPDRNFVRLTEAELAREALTDLRTTISHHKALKADAVDAWIDIVAHYERSENLAFRHDLARYTRTVLKLDRALR